MLTFRRHALALLLLAGGLGALSGCTMVVAGRHHPGPEPVHVVGWGRPAPRLVVITSTPIQYVVDMDDDIFFYSNVWYLCRGSVWYHCRTYGGMWVRVDSPPVVFARIPPRHAKHRVVQHVRTGPGPNAGLKPGPASRPSPRSGPATHGRTERSQPAPRAREDTDRNRGRGKDDEDADRGRGRSDDTGRGNEKGGGKKK